MLVARDELRGRAFARHDRLHTQELIKAMKTSYLVTLFEGKWGLYLWEDTIEILQAGLADEAAAIARAVDHATTNGFSDDFRILQAEPNGNITTVFDSSTA